MNYLLSFIILILFSTLGWGQKNYFTYENRKGDSIRIEIIEQPTICDCINVDWRNNSQQKVCALSYDYDFMSEEEQKAYDLQVAICEYPSICDCALAPPTDKGLIKACNSNYNYKNIPKEELEYNLREIEKCPKKETIGLDICACLNVVDDQLNKQCNDTFFNDSLVSEAQRTKNLEDLKNCITNKEYKLEVTACDCALNSELDEEFKKICDERIEQLKTNKKELTAYFYTLKACRETALLNTYISNKKLPKLELKYTVCRCNESEMEKEVIEKCNEIWNYKEMTPAEKQAFSNAVARCW